MQSEISTLPDSPRPNVEGPTQWQPLFSLPAWEIARFTVLNYLRSGWIMLDIVLVFTVFSVFFTNGELSADQFFSLALPSMALLSLLGSAILTQRTLKANLYLQLARLSSRAIFIDGVMLATALLRIPLYLLLLVFTFFIHHHIQGLTVAGFLLGSLGILLVMMLCAMLTVVLSRPIATRIIQIIFLVWIVIVLYTSVYLSPDLRHYMQIFQLPLYPISACYQFALHGTIDIWGWLGIVLLLLYMLVFVLAARYWFARRDLLFS